jgi:hypothetical protein
MSAERMRQSKPRNPADNDVPVVDSVTPVPDAHVLCVTGPQTIREAAQTHAALLGALRDHPAVALDCGSVTEVDLSFVQMIVSARRGAGGMGRRFALLHPPAGPLLGALVRGGLLSDPAAAAATDPDLWSGGGDAA